MAKKKVSLTQEEIQQQNLNRELNELRERLYIMSSPTHIFNIGDRVSIGNLENVYIAEILEEGKIYKISFGSDKSSCNARYVKWVDVRKYQEPMNMKSELIKNEDLKLDFTNTWMSDILSKAYHFGINFEPEYQRDYVWELEDKVKLIDSIFNGIDIGKFVFISNDYIDAYGFEVLDGKQRTRAILDFYEDRFRYKGKYFSDLSYREQDYFKSFHVSMATPFNLTEEQKLRYFLMLNTGGKVMSEEHLEKVRKRLNEIERGVL